jgi:predicted phage terminase large subunit-like protein
MEQYRDIDLLKTWTLHSVLNFTRYFFKQKFKRKFVIGQHHVKIAQALDRVLAGECKRLIINIAPRYGKTELAVKNFIAMGLAINPKAKFIHLSYSDDLARDNSRGVQEILREDSYRRLFPGTKPTSVNTRKWFTSEGGGLYAVSSAGQVTGFGAGIVDKDEEEELSAEVEELASVSDGTFGGAIVIDDPIKPDDARSDTVRDKVNQKFETTIRNRVNSRNTPIIIIMQRLDEQDLCGYLQKLEPEEWEVLSLPVIQTDEEGNEVALWPFKHTLEELQDLREKNSFVFDTQYMQNPRPIEGLMYERTFMTYQAIPITRKRKIKAYIDTADTGKDFLCCIIYVETEIGNFILDVYYTQAPMETTESETARRLTKYGVEECIVESNNGGRGFGRKVRDNCRILMNRKTSFTFFTQTDNKDVRIFNHSNEVQNLTVFPERWDLLWPQFYKAITQYKKEGGNAHDDAPDALTGTIEKRNKQAQNLTGIF